MNQDVFYDVMAWNPSTAEYDQWLGTATPEAIAKLGSNVRAGPLVGYEPAGKHPTGWAYRHRPAVLQALSAKCACGHPVFELKQSDQETSVVCLDCGNGMFKTNFDRNTGGWLAGWIDRKTMLNLRKVAGVN